MFNHTEFKVQLVRNSLTNKELAKEIGMDVSTLSRKLQNDGSFTRSEIVRISEVLKLEPEDIQRIFFA
jgi:DNA-binding Xre family transcriptional regulator